MTSSDLTGEDVIIYICAIYSRGSFNENKTTRPVKTAVESFRGPGPQMIIKLLFPPSPLPSPPSPWQNDIRNTVETAESEIHYRTIFEHDTLCAFVDESINEWIRNDVWDPFAMPSGSGEFTERIESAGLSPIVLK